MTDTEQQARTRLTVYVDRELAAQLHYLAVKTDRQISELVQEILLREIGTKVKTVDD
jgi:post-segregation antitoxin (ccd killing protein)